MSQYSPDIRTLALYDPLEINSIVERIYDGISINCNISKSKASCEFWKYFLYLEQKQNPPHLILHYQLGLDPPPTYLINLILDAHNDLQLNYQNFLVSIDEPSAAQKIDLNNRYLNQKLYGIVESQYCKVSINTIDNTTIRTDVKLTDEVSKWLLASCVHPYNIIGQCVSFNDQADETLFKLKFC